MAYPLWRGIHVSEDTMSFESSSEDPMDYLKTKDSEKEPLLGGKVAAAPPGKNV